jgi:phospholipase/carboxylesterase
MGDVVTERLAALLPPLLRSLEMLGFVARHFHPPDFGAVMDAAGTPDDDLRAVRGSLDDWPDELAGVRDQLRSAADAVLAAFEGLRSAPDQAEGIRAVFRALRYLPRAKEALYPLAAAVPAINSFFLDSTLRDDADTLARLAAPARNDTGVMHAGNEPGSRGGYSLYVPEFYTAAAATAATFSGAGCATRAAMAPSWLRPPQRGRLGR